MSGPPVSNLSVTYPTSDTTTNFYTNTFNGDGTETTVFSQPLSGDYTYTVTVLDGFGNVHILESDPAVPSFTGNNYYGTLTNYSFGGDFTVLNAYEQNPGFAPTYNNFYWLFTSAHETSGMLTLYNDNRAGTFVTPVCYAEDTRILTDQGEVAVQHLAVGDRVVTATGARRPIRWLGHRTIDCARHPDPRAVWPVRISAHAFGDSRPSRDLLVSPRHAVCVTCVTEVMIPAVALLNGATIAQHRADRVTYWHVELDSHDVLVANGMPAESYIDMDNRRFFIEADAIGLHAQPDGPPIPTHADYCRPFVDSGPILAAVRQQLTARAENMGWTTDNAVACHIVVDGETRQPQRDGDTLTVQLRASARHVRVVCDVFAPCDIDGGSDDRNLGLCLRSLTVTGLAERRIVPLDDPRLQDGFHPAECDGDRLWRWTQAEATLPASLWQGMSGMVEIAVGVVQSPVRTWTPSAEVTQRPHLATA